MSSPATSSVTAPISVSSGINVTRSEPEVSKPKPCCVCKEEKASRDECLLFSETGPEKCADKITAYKECMAGFGFKI